MTSMTSAMDTLSAHRLRHLHLILIIILTLASSSLAAPLWRHVTVVSTEGWKYDDVSVVLTGNADSLLVHHADSSKTVMALTGIVSIRNFRGEDITQYVYDPAETDTEQYAPAPPVSQMATMVSDSTDLAVVEDGPARSYLAIHFGGSAVTGDWFDGHSGRILLQISARVQAFNRIHFGMQYIRQTLELNSGIIVMDPLGYFVLTPDTIDYLDNYVQHEIYAVVGVNSGPRNYMQRYFYLELGGGVVTYTQEEQFVHAFSSYTGFGARLAVGYVRPVSRRFGMITELNSRYTGRWSGDNAVTGFLIGVNVGLTLMVGE